MRNFLYFKQGQRAVSLADIQAWGLAYAFDTAPATRKVKTGPSGYSGVVFTTLSQRESKDDLGFFPDRQVWRPMSDFGLNVPGLWIGLPSDRSAWPRPDDLLRLKMIESYSVPFEDAAGERSTWQVPINRPDLPSSPAAVADRVQKLFLAANSQIDLDYTTKQACRDAMSVMGLNYRVSIAEWSLLGLLTHDNVLAVLLSHVAQEIAVMSAQINQTTDTPQDSKDTETVGTVASREA